MGGWLTIPRVYAYLACLVALITILICLNAIAFAAFDLSDPLHARGNLFEIRMLSSLDNFRVETLAKVPAGQQQPSEDAITSMFEAAREATVRTVRLQSMRTITASGLVLVVCLAVFIGHWHWAGRLTRTQKPPQTDD